MENPKGVISQHDEACQRVAGRFGPRWLRSYVRGKLRGDRVYPAAYELLHTSPHPILDVGCGVGLLPFYLRERGCCQPVLGLDVDARKIEYAASIAASGYHDLEVRFHDVCSGVPEFSGNVAVFDVLHYLTAGAQRAVLQSLSQCVAPDGLLIIRDCPDDCRPRFWMTWIAEKFAQAISWNLDGSLHFPSRRSIDDAFESHEFGRETRPLWGASPFNNHIFIFRRTGSAVVPAPV